MKKIMKEVGMNTGQWVNNLFPKEILLKHVPVF
jgi:hypothetical protein